jgi:hypothetical protein
MDEKDHWRLERSDRNDPLACEAGLRGERAKSGAAGFCGGKESLAVWSAATEIKETLYTCLPK